MVDPAEGPEGVARAELLELVRIVHRYLPGSGMSAREQVEVRRDLQLLVAESHRHVFRPHVAEEMGAAVLSDVSRALPEEARATLHRSCVPHVSRLRATHGASWNESRDPWTSVLG